MTDWDPRTHSRYQRLRREWLRTADPVCCLCGNDVNTALPGRHPQGPTIEHTVPIRLILVQTQTKDEALDMACNTSLWAMAHSRCQSQQGARVTNGRTQPRRSSRRW